MAGAMTGTTVDGTSRIAVVEAFGEPLRARDVPLPDPEPGALVVEILATTICGSDVHLVAGDLPRGIPITLPLNPGHEMAGRVVAAGPGADRDSVGTALEAGDRVIWSAAPCRRCHTCTVLRRPSLCPTRVLGCFQTCERFPFVTGGFGHHSYVYPTSGRLRVPDELPDHWASAASCALRTAIEVVEAAGPIGLSEHVVVQGAGPVGLCATAVAAAHGARTVTVIGAPRGRLDVATAWGATHVLSVEDLDAGERAEAVRGITDGRGADVVLECAGVPGVVAEGLDLAALGARYVIAGTVGGPAQPIDVQRITLRGLRLAGVFSADIDAYWKALQFMLRRRDAIDWELLFGRRYALADAGEALGAMREGREIKPVLVPGAVG
jgi:L-iditol 2-dehydrogenase